MDAPSDASKHFRFYISRGEVQGEKTLIQYRTSTGSWDSRFSYAMLWDDLDFAKEKADELVRQKNRTPSLVKANIVIGRAIVAACPFFARIVRG